MASPDLTFEPESHTYRMAGRVVPSVTQVLSILSDFSMVDPAVLEAAADRGTKVHAAIDLDNRGELEEEALDPELAPYVTQWRRFLAESGFTVTASELRLYHKSLHYAGTCDTLIGHRSSWVLDVKTGAVPRYVGAQLAAYQHALDPRPRRRLCLALTPTNYSLRECKSLADFSLFQSCLNVWRFKNAA
jgi:hypothetical protein